MPRSKIPICGLEPAEALHSIKQTLLVTTMQSLRTAAKSFSLLVASQVLCYVSAFFSTTYTARYLGAGGFGVLSYGLACAGIAAIVADLGFRKLLVRDGARDKSVVPSYVGNLLAMRLGFVGLLSLCCVGALVIAGVPSSTARVVGILLLGAGCRVLSEVVYAAFQSQEELRYEAAGNVINSAIVLVGTLYSIITNGGVESFAWAYLSASLVVLGYSMALYAIRIAIPQPKIELRFWRSKIFEALPFGLVGVFEVIYHWLDTIMLSLLQSHEAVGMYNAAYRLFLLSLFVPSAVNLVVFPIMSRLSATSHDELEILYDQYFKLMMIMGVGLGVAGSLLADEVVLAVYGSEYADSIVALQILLWSAVLIFMNSAFVRLLESIGNQSLVTKAAGWAAALNIGLNLVLIPSHSYIGASIATVLSELLITAWLVLAVSRTSYGLPSSASPMLLLRVISAAGVMGLVIWGMKGAMHDIVVAPVAVGVYCLAIYLLNVYDRSDMALVFHPSGKL